MQFVSLVIKLCGRKMFDVINLGLSMIISKLLPILLTTPIFIINQL